MAYDRFAITATPETTRFDSADYVALCREQRQAYFAWQADPAGSSGIAFRDYQAASKRLTNYEAATGIGGGKPRSGL